MNSGVGKGLKLPYTSLTIRMIKRVVVRLEEESVDRPGYQRGKESNGETVTSFAKVLEKFLCQGCVGGK